MPQDKGLTRDLIAQTCLAMADEQGIEHVSARKLAAQLGCTPMALYRHFENIDAIHAEAVALAFTEVDAAPHPGEMWDETLRRTTASIRAMYLHHARANLHLAEGAGDSPALAAHTQRIYGLHEAQGIPPAILQKLWRLIDAFLSGFIDGELHELQLRAEDDPTIASAEAWRQTAHGAYSEETFHDGINIIIAGTRALAAPSPCDWHTSA